MNTIAIEFEFQVVLDKKTFLRGKAVKLNEGFKLPDLEEPPTYVVTYDVVGPYNGNKMPQEGEFYYVGGAGFHFLYTLSGEIVVDQEYNLANRIIAIIDVELALIS